jgi:hypothetical protein
MLRAMRLIFGLTATLAIALVSAPALAQETTPLPVPIRFPPRTLPYEDGDAIPPGYHLEDRPDYHASALGGAIFGAAWVPSAIVAAAVVGARQPDAKNVAPLAIPVAGPFLTILSAKAHPAGGAVLAFDGIAQLGGAILFFAGFKMNDPLLVLNPIPAAAHVSIGPGFTGLSGTF